MIKDTFLAVKNLMGKRRLAYNRVFDKENKYTDYVLRDLAKFCRAHESTFHKDERIHAALEGRREVWLIIEQYLKLNVDELFELHKIKNIIRGEK